MLSILTKIFRVSKEDKMKQPTEVKFLKELQDGDHFQYQGLKFTKTIYGYILKDPIMNPDTPVSVDKQLVFRDLKPTTKFKLIKYKSTESDFVYVATVFELTTDPGSKVNAFCIEGPSGSKYNHYWIQPNEPVVLV